MRSKRTGRILACKEVLLTSDPRAFPLFIREIDVLAKLAHPAILGLIGHVMPRKADGQNVGLIFTEWLERGSLDDLLYDPATSAALTPTIRAKAAIGISVAMRYMHSSGVIHRDLKPGNILLDQNFEVRVGDLGSSRFTDLKQTLTGAVGTPFYMAPEIASAEGEMDYDEKVDVFSFAILLWELVTGQKAYAGFASGNPVAFLNRVTNGLRPEMVPMPPLAEDLVTRCWTKDPTLRPSFEEIVTQLTENGYAIVEGVSVDEVSGYVVKLEEFERKYPPQRAFTIQEVPS
jgi:serine/threonine protein kinase